MPEYDPADAALSVEPPSYRRCPVCRRPPKVSFTALLAALALGGAVGGALAGEGSLLSWLVTSALTAVSAALATLDLLWQ